MQDELRRLAHRANEEEEGTEVRRVPLRPKEGELGLRDLGRGGENVVEPHAVHKEEEREDTEREAEITHTVDNKRLHRGGMG